MKTILLKNPSKIYTIKSRGPDKLGVLEGYSLLIRGEKIEKIDKYENIKAEISEESLVIDCQGKSLLPGFVDPHTHLVFGGDRKEEYFASLESSDKEILKSKLGRIGLESSIYQTRQAGYDGLMKTSKEKLDIMLTQGITTVEIKSGYGIDKEIELTQLRVIKDLREQVAQTLIATYLGGHYWDEEMGKAAYIDFMIGEVLPVIKEEDLAQRIDIWIDKGFYNYEEAKKLLEAGKAIGLEVTLHSDAYSSIGGSKLAAELDAQSADHLNYLSDQDLELMKEKNVVGIILPGTDYSVNHPKPVNGRDLIDKGLDLALGTNLNPGNYSFSLQFIMDLACRKHGLRPEEALIGTSINAARALGLEKDYGSIEVGKFADLQIWDTDDFRDSIYKHGMNYVNTVIKHGKIVVKEGQIVE